MNIQTEHLQDQTARFTVEIDPERLDKAKQKAARHLAKRVNIPGFRKGKVPYRILVQNGLEPQIEMDAIEELSQEIYRETLEQSEIQPYGPGSFDDYKTDPTPVFIYTVPLQPTVELNDYRSVRAEYIEPEVTDEAVDDTLKRIQEQEALTEESHQAAAWGNKLTVDIHSEYADDPPGLVDAVLEDESEEEAEPETESSESEDEFIDDDEDIDDEIPAKGDPFVHEHDMSLMLNAEEETILKGFSEALIGANTGDEVDFELTITEEDASDSESMVGRKIKFHVIINKIETITLPALNDELAAKLTEEEDEPLTLLQLRMRIRENMQKDLTRRVREEYAANLIGQMVEIAEIAYPEAMIEDQVESMVKDFGQRLGQQGINLEMYMRVTGSTIDNLKEMYRSTAEDAIKRSLILGQLVVEENIQVPEERIEAHINEILADLGEQAEAARGMLDNPNIRASIVDKLREEIILDRIIAIGRGEAGAIEASETPEISEAPETEETPVTDNEETE